MKLLLSRSLEVQRKWKIVSALGGLKFYPSPLIHFGKIYNDIVKDLCYLLVGTLHPPQPNTLL